MPSCRTFLVKNMTTRFPALLGVALLGGLMLAGCNMSALTRGWHGTDDVRLLDVAGEGFGALLAQEYRNLAVLEEEFRNDAAAAAPYAAKATRAKRGTPVWPEDPTKVKLPPARQRELALAYNMVLDALAHMRSEDNAALLALAQTRYDCWLERTVAGRDSAEISICRDMMNRALGMLNVPAGRGMTYVVRFADDETVLGEDALAVIEQAAQAWEGRAGWEVQLVGHAATKGNRDHNRRLSMRRAVAVRNMLAQQGVDPDAVTIVARTDSSNAPAPETGRSVDIRFAPSYLLKDGPVLESLESLDR